MLAAKVKWTDGLQFVGQSGSGHAIVMDGYPEVGGANTGMRPMELLLTGPSGCSGMDVASILTKKRLHVTGIEINVKGNQATDYPKKYTDIEIEFVITGKGLTDEPVKKAIDISMEKYCSVKASLEGTAKINYTYKIVEED
ncbi:MAG: OsmC family protein [Nitrospirales bacterium]|nr:OsmC family protein [Nitrospirales bacterium]